MQFLRLLNGEDASRNRLVVRAAKELLQGSVHPKMIYTPHITYRRDNARQPF